jgi:hypothetical protein
MSHFDDEFTDDDTNDDTDDDTNDDTDDDTYDNNEEYDDNVSLYPNTTYVICGRTRVNEDNDVLSDLDKRKYNIDSDRERYYYVVEHLKRIHAGWTHKEFYEMYIKIAEPNEKVLEMFKDIEGLDCFIVEIEDHTEYGNYVSIVCTDCWDFMVHTLHEVKNYYADIEKHNEMHQMIKTHKVSDINVNRCGYYCNICHHGINNFLDIENHQTSHPHINKFIRKLNDVDFYCDLCEKTFPMKIFEVHTMVHELVGDLINGGLVFDQDEKSTYGELLFDRDENLSYGELLDQDKYSSDKYSSDTYSSDTYSSDIPSKPRRVCHVCCSICLENIVESNNVPLDVACSNHLAKHLKPCMTIQKIPSLLVEVKKSLDDKLFIIACGLHDRLGYTSPINLLPQYVLQDISHLLHQTAFLGLSKSL